VSVNQSLVHAGVAWDAKVEITWIDSHKFETGQLQVEEQPRLL
jgi:CTP synthase (UTP-ammonia lyase)